MKKYTSAMKISKKDLKKLINEEVKKFLKKKDESSKAEVKGEAEEAPVETPTKPKEKEKPTPSKRPLRIPWKLPGPMPKPNPKAEKKNINENANNHIALFERERMRQLMEDMPMNIDPSQHGGPHPSIKSGIEGRKETPFSAIELFTTRALNQSAIEKLGSEEYNAIVQHVMAAEQLSMQEIMNTVQLIIRLERPHKTRLEELSLSIIQQKFGLPDEVTEKIKASLTQNIEPPEGGGDDENPAEEAIDEFSEEQQVIIKQHLDKRIIHNALMMGAGYRAHSVFAGIKNNLDAIDERLFPLYSKLMPNVELFLWKMPVEEMFGARQMWGKSELDIEGSELKGAEAQAIMFPILLHEVAKAAVEILTFQHMADVWEKHGEPVYNAIMKKSESYLDEHWMKLVGPRLWKYLHDAIDYVVKSRDNDYTIFSYILNRLAIMEPQEFMELMSDVLNRGDVAIQKIEAIMDKVQDDIENFEQEQNRVPAPEEITPGENNEDEIELLLKQNEKNLLQTKEPEGQPAPQRKKLADMEIDELNIELEKAIDKENFERAGKIRDLINAKTNRR
jgi:hypothetical protein